MDASRQVNTLLSTLRGEQFRHSQNVRKDRTHLGAPHTRTGPTLPSNLFSLPSASLQPVSTENTDNANHSATLQTNDSGINADEIHTTNTKVVAGPVPRSWALQADKHNQIKLQTIAMERRFDALSVVLPRLPSTRRMDDANSAAIPRLTMLCLRILISSVSADDFAADVVPHLPPHLRRDIMRYTAVHEPLTSAQLYALCEPEGHAGGELLVIGPKALLRPDHFRKTAAGAQGPSAFDWDQSQQCLRGKGDDDDQADLWDASADERAWDTPLQTFVLVCGFISTQTLLTIPPTLTTLALIALSSPVPIHRLPDVCPLIATLDLSNNPWLADGASPGAYSTTLERTKWGKWARLKVFALRGIRPSQGVLQAVNKGRWNDVEIIV
ncbi:hypothetical protein HWV62_41775 [Athelia sp. TMB]|nr:hypothetical protein HWV62_41775 [Athelia sp. TMB]